MMLASTANNIYGSTSNPYVKSLSSGGAAGGKTYFDLCARSK
jgi:Asp-tRNA(Asn)/Glu-tRNA(Gln) amidotransferase A subunit family amidase